MEESFLQHAGYKQLKDKYPYLDFKEQVDLAENDSQRILEKLETGSGFTKPVPVNSHYRRSESVKSEDSGIQSLSPSPAGEDGCCQKPEDPSRDAAEKHHDKAASGEIHDRTLDTTANVSPGDITGSYRLRLTLKLDSDESDVLPQHPCDGQILNYSILYVTCPNCANTVQYVQNKTD